MKRTVIALTMVFVLFLAGAAFADMGKFTGALKVGVDFAGDWDADNTPVTYDTKTSWSIAGEGYYKVIDYVDLGGGVQYLFPRKIDTSPNWKFWFVPVYAAARVHPPMTDYTPYGIVQIGYAFHGGNANYFNNLDTSGGFYWGVGAGFIFKRHYLAEILYSEANGSGDVVPGVSTDINHSRWTFSLGYNF